MMPMPRPLGTLAFLLAWLMPWRSAFRARAVPSDLTFFVHHRDALGRHIAKYGTHEPLLTSWLANYFRAARPGLFIDVGANVGWHALHAARHRAIEAVVAFEPDPFNASLLERNVRANGSRNVIISTRAVGAGAGTIRLFRYKSSNLGRHSIVVDHGYGSLTVPVIDLDNALTELQLDGRAVAALKIDVEGFEPEVIEGASKTLKRTHVIILEYSPHLSRTGMRGIEDMLKRLQNAGFCPFALRAYGGVARINADELHQFEGSIDILWAKQHAIAGLGERAREAISLRKIAEQNMRVKALATTPCWRP
jgi:FkbM family methyltransferase